MVQKSNTVVLFSSALCVSNESAVSRQVRDRSGQFATVIMQMQALDGMDQLFSFQVLSFQRALCFAQEREAGSRFAFQKILGTRVCTSPNENYCWGSHCFERCLCMRTLPPVTHQKKQAGSHCAFQILGIRVCTSSDENDCWGSHRF